MGAAPMGKESDLLKKLLKAKGVYSVAVDGGISFFEKEGKKPDYWIGDMDSASAGTFEAAFFMDIKNEDFCKVPVMKDDTDMGLAVKKAYEHGCREILIFGGTGGDRISHTIANIQLMLYYAKRDCHITMISEKSRMEVLHKGIKAFSKEMKGLLSVFSLSDKTEDVRIEGLKYTHRGNLENDFALGVSNAFVGKEGRVAAGEGYLLLVYENDETGEMTDE